MKAVHLLTVLVAFTGACATSPALSAEKSLYERLGGYDGIAAVSDDFLGRLEHDGKLGRFFVGLSDDSIGRVRQHVVELVCFASGGPCIYTGRDMKTSHKGLEITGEDWKRMLSLFGETMKAKHVPEKEQKDMAAVVGPLEKDIVEKP